MLPIISIMAVSFKNATTNPPSVFPIKEGAYSKIAAEFNLKFTHPFTGKKTVHGGIDIVAKEGTPVMAAGDGTVVSVADKDGWGKLIIIQHGEEFDTYYAHLSKFAVTEKQRVKSGQIIGYVGNTGYSTGPHLHFEVRQNGERVNPLDFCSH